MNKNLDMKLVKDFPNLYRKRFDSRYETPMGRGFELSDGWFDLIYALSEKLEKIIIQSIIKNPPVSFFRTKKFWNSLISKFKKVIPDAIFSKIIFDLKLEKIPCVEQVKEKFGSLCFYMSHHLEEMSGFLKEAEMLSEKTCEICGKEGKLSSHRGWLSVRCLEHKISA